MKKVPISGVMLAALVLADVIVLAASTASAGCIVHMSNGEDKPCESLSPTDGGPFRMLMWVHDWLECMEEANGDDKYCASQRVYEWLECMEANQDAKYCARVMEK
jgi:hypothetical protein